MTNEEILQKAIEKAQNKGWDGYFTSYGYEGSCSLIRDMPATGFIFSHEFAKAFFGIHKVPKTGRMIPIWELCLTEMVLYQNPLEYLENFI